MCARRRSQLDLDLAGWVHRRLSAASDRMREARPIELFLALHGVIPPSIIGGVAHFLGAILSDPDDYVL